MSQLAERVSDNLRHSVVRRNSGTMTESHHHNFSASGSHISRVTSLAERGKVGRSQRQQAANFRYIDTEMWMDWPNAAD